MRIFAAILVLCLPWLAMAALGDAASGLRRELAMLQRESFAVSAMPVSAGASTGLREELRLNGELRGIRVTLGTGARQRALGFYFRSDGELFAATIADSARDDVGGDDRTVTESRTACIDGGRIVGMFAKTDILRDGTPVITPAARAVPFSDAEADEILRLADAWKSARSPSLAAAPVP